MCTLTIFNFLVIKGNTIGIIDEILIIFLLFATYEKSIARYALRKIRPAGLLQYFLQ